MFFVDLYASFWFCVSLVVRDWCGVVMSGGCCVGMWSLMPDRAMPDAYA